uniref:Uncharacterized protein n=1 Tax=Phlebia radiata TaxID=5308 RepID=L8B9G6_PHLRA|nr:hypothetical protein Pra_mt0325 [Phlebia radiata]CCF07393.1 hypothetical protein Pra_mt0325 [Phlebia radiata]
MFKSVWHSACFFISLASTPYSLADARLTYSCLFWFYFFFFKAAARLQERVRGEGQGQRRGQGLKYSIFHPLQKKISRWSLS